MLAIITIALLADVFIYYTFIKYIFLYKPEPSFSNIMITLACVFGTGAALFIFRKSCPKNYGVLELIIAGLNVITYLIASTPEEEKAYVTLFSHLATLYIIVRGLDSYFAVNKDK